MATRMFHPKHGWTHAYGAHDVEKHKANGWILEGEKLPETKPTEPEKRKPGRPKKG